MMFENLSNGDRIFLGWLPHIGQKLVRKKIYGLKRHEEFIFINIKVLKNSYLKRFILNIKNVKK